MKRKLIYLFAAIMFLSFASMAGAASYTVNTNNDWALGYNSTVYNSYICEKDAYEAYFDFDLSFLPDDTVFSSMTFNASIYNPTSSERTVWNGETLIGSKTFQSSDYTFEAFDIDLTALGWAGEDTLTLTLTGPSNGSHICAWVEMLESQSPAFLSFETGVSVPEPASMLLLGFALLGLLGIRRRVR